MAKTSPGEASQTACTAFTSRMAVTIIPETLWSPSSPWWVRSIRITALAEAGADLVLAARSADQLEGVAKAVEAAGRRAYVVAAHWPSRSHGPRR